MLRDLRRYKAVPSTITNDDRISFHKPVPPPPKDKDKDKDKTKDPSTHSAKGKKTPSFRHVTPRGFPDHKVKTTEHSRLAGTDLSYLYSLPEEPKVGQEYKAAFAYQSVITGEWLYADLHVQSPASMTPTTSPMARGWSTSRS